MREALKIQMEINREKQTLKVQQNAYNKIFT